MIKELDSVVLTTDLPEHGLARDDIGTVVLVHEGGKGCTVEFMTLAGHHCRRYAAGESNSANCQRRNCSRATGSSCSLIANQFQRRTSVVEYTHASLKKALPVVKKFAELEGLDAHGKSAEVRRK